jgi:hypothetical protein
VFVSLPRTELNYFSLNTFRCMHIFPLPCLSFDPLLYGGQLPQVMSLVTRSNSFVPSPFSVGLCVIYVYPDPTVRFYCSRLSELTLRLVTVVFLCVRGARPRVYFPCFPLHSALPSVRHPCHRFPPTSCAMLIYVAFGIASSCAYNLLAFLFFYF